MKRYGTLEAVRGLDLEVPEGEFFGLLGPNGAGKTTTLSCLVGLTLPTEGTLEVHGADVVREPRRARLYIGLAPQEYNFDRYLTVRETLVYSAGYFGIPARTCAERADDLLKRFDLWDKWDGEVQKMSGGMKRRLTIARALIHRPRVLVLDEPTAGVDVELRFALWSMLRALSRDEGLTIILTTHYLEEAEQLCSRIGIMREGRILALAPTRTLTGQGERQVLEVTYAAPVTMPQDTTPPPALDWDESRMTVRVGNLTPDQVAACMTRLSALGPVTRVDLRHRSLQDVFLEITSHRAAVEASR
ncbi:MAG: ABC transporter ATP-binding protein [Candidatus Sericytochromatia bacterium]|nr:ABC transporter ATP-binding protein [Candidatus Sericytochromatia bacterium]